MQFRVQLRNVITEQFTRLCNVIAAVAAESSLPGQKFKHSNSSYFLSDLAGWINLFSSPSQSIQIRSSKFIRKIFSDASLNDWGTSCSELRTHGWCPVDEGTPHGIAAELKAVFFTLCGFAADLRDCDILLRFDNATT